MPQVNFCIGCGAPINAAATLGPFERVFAEGFVLREAAYGKHTRLLTVMGVWLFFFPLTVSGIGMTLLNIRNTHDLHDLVYDAILIVFTVWPAVFIYRVTQNYLSKK